MTTTLKTLVEQKMMDDIDFLGFIVFSMVILQEPFWSSKSFFGSMRSQLSLPAPNLGAHLLRYVAFLTMMHPGNGHQKSGVTTNIDIAKFFSKRILRHGNKESNLIHQSGCHVTSSVQVISQSDLSFHTSHMKSAPQFAYYFLIWVILNFE
jgi:hypothetical protein